MMKPRIEVSKKTLTQIEKKSRFPLTKMTCTLNKKAQHFG